MKGGPVRIGRPREKLREAASRKRGVALLALREAVGAAKLRTYTGHLRRGYAGGGLAKGLARSRKGKGLARVSQWSRKGKGLADRVRPGYAQDMPRGVSLRASQGLAR